MTRSPSATCGKDTLSAALELGKNSWLLAIQLPERDTPSRHPITGGDAEALMAKLDAARHRLVKASGQVAKLVLCYEAGYDGFWLARLLLHRAIDCRLMAPASLQLNCRARRVKTDRIDVENILDRLIAWCHHERWDGSGYPRGLKGEEIPIEARIVAVADIYDALRSQRPYKPGFDHDRVLAIMLDGEGRTKPDHFEPGLLEIFRAKEGDFARIFTELAD